MTVHAELSNRLKMAKRNEAEVKATIRRMSGELSRAEHVLWQIQEQISAIETAMLEHGGEAGEEARGAPGVPSG